MSENERRSRRALVTGLGVVSPVGVGKERFWSSLMSGKTGMARIKAFDVSTFPTKLAAQVLDFDPAEFLSPRQIKYFARGTQFGVAAAKMAFTDSRLDSIDPRRTDVIMGVGISALDELERELDRSETALATYIGAAANPATMLRAFINASAAAISLEYGIKGYVTTVSSACTSGLNSVGFAAQRIMEGNADLVFAGGVETPITRIILNAYCVANFLTKSEDPAEALCPFDKRRTKAALGEGSAIFIIEEMNHALARNADVYAEIVSFRQENENVNELYMLDGSGKAWSEVISSVLDDRVPSAINAHAPSDRQIDRAEAQALNLVLGKRSRSVPVFSIKGSVGSGVSSAGAFQVAAGVLAIQRGELPPVFNYKVPDPECDLNVVDAPQRNLDLDTVLVNAHGLGGANASILLSRFSI